MARQHMGRHRAPDYSPLSEIADIAARSAQPAMKVSAVAVASGGLVATFALPASAAPAHEDTGVTTAAGAPVSTLPQIAGQTVAVAAPAVDNAVAPTFGVVGFTAQPAAAAAAQPLTITKVAQPAPAPAPRRSGSRRRDDHPRLADHDPHGGPGRQRGPGPRPHRRHHRHRGGSVGHLLPLRRHDDVRLRLLRLHQLRLPAGRQVDPPHRGGPARRVDQGLEPGSG